jgi:hypothetical protein
MNSPERAMKPIVADTELVAYCGLYCGACRSYLKGRCPGCHGNDKATWCKVRSCCRELQYTSCASCTEFTDPRACRKYNNLIAKLFGLVFNSDRAACIDQIRTLGMAAHAERMAASGRQSIRRGGARPSAPGA